MIRDHLQAYNAWATAVSMWLEHKKLPAEEQSARALATMDHAQHSIFVEASRTPPEGPENALALQLMWEDYGRVFGELTPFLQSLWPAVEENCRPFFERKVA